MKMNTKYIIRLSLPSSLSAIIVLVFTLMANTAFSQAKIATTAAQFLGISVGARASSMGGAFVAMNNDVSSLYWNPGAFSQSAENMMTFSNTDWLVGTKFRWFGGMFHLGDIGSVGISVTQLDYGEEDVTTVLAPDGTGERWSAQDYSAALSYSRRLTDRFSVGGTVKYISQRIWNESASTIALDLGLLFVTGFNDMRLGMSISNFGGDMQLDGRDLLQRVDIDPGNTGSNKTLVGKLKTDPWPIPLIFRVGIAMDVMKNDFASVTVALDAVRPSDNTEFVNAGAEVSFANFVYVRGGYRSLFRDDVEEGLNLGAGIRYSLEGAGSVGIDYAYHEFGLFGNLNTIGITVGF